MTDNQISMSKPSVLWMGCMFALASALLFVGGQRLAEVQKRLEKSQALAKRYKYDLAAVGPCSPPPDGH